MSNTDALTGKLLELINQVQGTVADHSARAVGLVLTSTRIDGICFLSGALLGFLILLGFIYILIKCKKEGDSAEPVIFFSCLLAFCCLLCLIYPWNWIQVFNPKLYVAHQIINKVMN